MATLAPRPEISFVRVVLAVAPDTGQRRTRELGFRLVTACAREWFMSAGQSKIGKRMIEGLGVERDHLEATTLVIGVAGRADLSPHDWIATMVTRARFEILRDALVTALALSVLLCPREWNVAREAVGFETGVRLRQLSRRNQSPNQR